MATIKKVIDGKTYYFDCVKPTKAEAEKYATDQRRKGWFVRVIKAKGGYLIFSKLY